MTTSGIGWYWIIDIMRNCLRPLVDIVSPTLRKELEDFILNFYRKSLETDNPWDDFLARFLLRIFAISIPR